MLKQKQQNHPAPYFHPNILGVVIILHFFFQKEKYPPIGKIKYLYPTSTVHSGGRVNPLNAVILAKLPLVYSTGTVHLCGKMENREAFTEFLSTTQSIGLAARRKQSFIGNFHGTPVTLESEYISRYRSYILPVYPYIF